MQYTTRDKCLNTAYAILARQPRTERQMYEKLTAKGFEQTLVIEIISVLKQSKLIDDLNFAEQYINSHKQRHGKYRLENALKQKGVAGSVIAKAYGLLYEEESLSETDIAVELLKKKILQLNIDRERWRTDFEYRQKNTAKLMRFLAGRGFSASIARDGLKHIFADEFFYE